MIQNGGTALYLHDFINTSQFMCTSSQFYFMGVKPHHGTVYSQSLKKVKRQCNTETKIENKKRPVTNQKFHQPTAITHLQTKHYITTKKRYSDI